MQDDIVTRVARSLHFEMVAIDAIRLAQDHSGAFSADDLSLRCQAAMWNSETTPDGMQTAGSVCEQALKANVRDAMVLSNISVASSVGVMTGQSADPQADLAHADDLASRALALDPNNSFAHCAKSLTLLGRGRSEEAIAEGERSLALNPGFTTCYVPLCIANNYLVRPDRCLELADKAIRISPRDPLLRLFYHLKGWALFAKQEYAEAIETLRLAGRSRMCRIVS